MSSRHLLRRRDFNQMLDLEIPLPEGSHISTFNEESCLTRSIVDRASLLLLHRRRRKFVRRTNRVRGMGRHSPRSMHANALPAALLLSSYVAHVRSRVKS